MQKLLGGMALVALVGCSPAVPDSAAGVGFGDYDEFQQQKAQRDAALNGGALPAAQPISQEPLSALGGDAAGSASPSASGNEAEQLAAETAAALNSGETPLQASPQNPAPQVAVAASGISTENNFENVSAVRSIESDKQKIAANRAQYQLVEPTALPTRDGSEGPNIVAYALETSHPVGTALYKRFAASQARADRNCAKYASSDLAQAAFLAKGGPQKDRLGVDPDGDGYACYWDPAPYRKVNGG